MREELEKGDIGEDGCPCGTLRKPDYAIHSHCWRTYINGRVGGCKCEFSGVHYWAKPSHLEEAKKHAEEIASYIEEAWMLDKIPVVKEKTIEKLYL